MKSNYMERNYFYFLLATAFIGIGQSVDGAILNNYLKEGLGMMILQRSALEFPRELPGLLMVAIIGMLSFLGDIRTMLVGNLLAAIGMLALGLIPAQYSLVIISIFIYNMGTHIYMPMSNSIGMSFASAGELGQKLGRMNAVNTFTLVVSGAILWMLFKFLHISYMTAFSIGAAAYIAAAVSLMFIKQDQTVKQPSRFVLNKEYGLYYWLSILFGARKQIFLTFGPWVLVDVFRQSVATMAMLFFIVSVSGIFVKPWIGKMIDSFGERFVLRAEAVICFIICLGYAFADNIFGIQWALPVICACYIVDQSTSAVSMARATYMKKIALTKEEISSSLALGTSLDHLVTVFLPFLGGLIWYNNGPNGYKYVFMAGAVIAVMNFISARYIKTEARAERENI